MTSEYLKVVEAELHIREGEVLFDAMRKMLRRAAFTVDSTRLIMTDPVSRELAKELAQEYRDLANRADTWLLKDHADQGEECSERR